jgi:hypothetical protein
MQDSSNPKSGDIKANTAKEYDFGGIQEYSLEKIEDEILNESLYLDVFAGSDIAFKENVNSLENILPSLSKIRCISYNYKTEQFAHKGFPKTKQFGVIAQDIQMAFPELVRNDQDGDLQVNYTQLSTVAIQAVKELSSMLIESNKRIERLETELTKLKTK